jgi:hypothetical protein
LQLPEALQPAAEEVREQVCSLASKFLLTPTGPGLMLSMLLAEQVRLCSMVNVFCACPHNVAADVLCIKLRVT